MNSISLILVLITINIKPLTSNSLNLLMTPDYEPLPTLRRQNYFNATVDAIYLHKAMEGLGTDEGAIVDIMTHRSEPQRHQIERVYNEKFDRNLLEDLNDELTGCLKDLITGLLLGTKMYLATKLQEALHPKLFGTVDKSALIDIIAPRSNQELSEIATAYSERYDTQLMEDLNQDTTKMWRNILTAMVNSSDEPRDTLNVALARRDADMMMNAGFNMDNMEESMLIKIMTRREPRHIREMFKAYEKKAGRSFENFLTTQTSRTLREILLTIVRSVQNRAMYFAMRLHQAMDGIGTDEATLRQILLSRAEKDLGNIKAQYQRIYGRTLASHIESEMSGHSLQAMLALIGN